MEKHIEPLTVHDPMEEAGADFPVAQGRATHEAYAKQVTATERVTLQTSRSPKFQPVSTIRMETFNWSTLESKTHAVGTRIEMKTARELM